MYKKKSLWWEKSLNETNIIKSISKVVKYGNISTAKKTTEFENKIKNFLNVKNVITVSNGSMANLLLFLAIGLKAGDEIIIPNTGWISIINTCKIMNLKPVIVDLESSRPLLDIKNIEKFISKKTKVIFPVYMNGRKIDLSKIKRICKRRGIFLIEDAAQSFGVKFKNKYLGTIGDAGIFSTSITKIFTTGLGGFICTNNNRLAKKIYEMRRHGFSDIKNIRNWSKFGGNFKLSDIQCAIGIEQLKKIKKDFKSNIDNFELFKKLLKPSIKYIEPAVIDTKNGEIPVYNEYNCKRRGELVNYLMKKKIETRLYSPNFENVKYLNFKKTKKNFVNSKLFEKNTLYLPSGPGLKKSEVIRVAKIINKFYAKKIHSSNRI